MRQPVIGFPDSMTKKITVFKNGGGGHLDLMVAHILYNEFIQQVNT